jgi:hypothetical protein
MLKTSISGQREFFLRSRSNARVLSYHSKTCIIQYIDRIDSLNEMFYLAHFSLMIWCTGCSTTVMQIHTFSVMLMRNLYCLTSRSCYHYRLLYSMINCFLHYSTSDELPLYRSVQCHLPHYYEHFSELLPFTRLHYQTQLCFTSRRSAGTQQVVEDGLRRVL